MQPNRELDTDDGVEDNDNVYRFHSDYEQKKREMAEFIQIGLSEGQQWFFWCLKGARYNTYSGEPDGWEWPPRMSGRIAASDKKEVKKLLAEEFGEEYPMRVLRKDQVKFPFLLYIEQMSVGSHGERYIHRFMPTECAQCKTIYVLNDAYNDPHGSANSETCSDLCRKAQRLDSAAASFSDGLGVRLHTPVIYCITHKPTGQRYVGKTDQPFTLRWYQHMYHPGTSKFHQMIRGTPLTDWTFEVLEVIEATKTEIAHESLGKRDYVQRISLREQHWINHFNSIKGGLNSVASVAACISLPDDMFDDSASCDQKEP